MSTATATDRRVDAYVGEQVHQRLWVRRIPQATACDAIGIARGTLHRKMRGEVTWSVSDLMAVAGVLGVPVADLLPRDQAALDEWWRAREDSNLHHTGYYVRPHTYPLIPAQRQASRTVTR